MSVILLLRGRVCIPGCRQDAHRWIRPVQSQAGLSGGTPDLKIVNYCKCISPDNRSSRLVGLAVVLPSRGLQSIGHRGCPHVAVLESRFDDLFQTASLRSGKSGRLLASTEHNENQVANRKNIHTRRLLIARTRRVRWRHRPAVRHIHATANAGPAPDSSARAATCTCSFASPARLRSDVGAASLHREQFRCEQRAGACMGNRRDPGKRIARRRRCLPLHLQSQPLGFR